METEENKKKTSNLDIIVGKLIQFKIQTDIRLANTEFINITIRI